MKFFIKKILITLLLVVYGLSYAQNTPECNPFDFPDGCPPASPIDMYVYVLGAAAVLMIAYFAKKYKTQKI